MSVSSEAWDKDRIGGSKLKLTVCRVLRSCDNFDENLTRTRLRHVYEAKGDPTFGHKGSFLLDGSHFFLAHDEHRSFSSNYMFP